MTVDHLFPADVNIRRLLFRREKFFFSCGIEKFSAKLKPLGIKVRELTGDVQLSRSEIDETQMLVTTPEKWDVVTRKSISDPEMASKIKLMILDEIHLLQDDRGAVIEALVARTLRQVNLSQKMI